VKRLFCLAPLAMILASLCSHLASAAFIVPDGSTAPFEDWSRTDPNSMYAEWNTFTVANGAPANTPDVGSFGPTPANLEQNGAFAIITSGGNIYSFAGATGFDMTVPNYGYGIGYDTRVAVQLRTLGNPIDVSSLLLTFDDGNGPQSLAPSSSVGPTPDADGQEWLFVWDVANFNAASMLVEFNASASSMSLDRLAVDTFTQAVPEPASLHLAAWGWGAAGPLVAAVGSAWKRHQRSVNAGRVVAGAWMPSAWGER
jgi:hypothetical protein